MTAFPGISAQLTPAFFPRWQIAVGKVVAGAAPARILFVGDSTTQGAYASAYNTTYPADIQALEAAASVFPRVAAGAVWSSGIVPWTDPRIVLGTGWVSTTLTTRGFGTGGWSAPITAVGTFAFTPATPIDTITCYYAQAPGVGSAAVNVDGGAPLGVLVGASGGAAVGVTTLACPSGVHTINVAAPTVGTFYLLGIEAYLSTSPPVLFSDAGTNGSDSTTDTSHGWTCATTPWAHLSMFDAFKPDLTIISLDINDAGASLAAATHQANISTLVAKAQLYGDVLLQNCVPSQNAPYTTFEALYTPADLAVAIAKTCGFYDVGALFGSWAAANAAGQMFNSLHPNDYGYSFWANGMFAALNAISPAPAGGGKGTHGWNQPLAPGDWNQPL